MKVILLNDVPKVGKKFDVKDVASGYALNMLIPKGLAEVASEKSIKKIESHKAQEAAQKKKEEEQLVSSLESIKNMTVEIAERANEKGHLFAAIHKDKIVALLKERSGIELLPEYIVYDKPIKEVGEDAIEVKVGDKSIKIKLVVKGQAA